jgi:hypothetical protein
VCFWLLLQSRRYQLSSYTIYQFGSWNKSIIELRMIISMFDISRHLILKIDVLGWSCNTCHSYSGGARFDLVRDTNCRGSGFSWFFIGTLYKFWGNTSIRLLPLLSVSFVDHCNSSILLLSLTQPFLVSGPVWIHGQIFVYFSTTYVFWSGTPLPREEESD